MSKLADTLADIQRITSIEDPVLRNLWITQRYHDLSKGLAGVVHAKNLNWSSFACWASLTAGISIRNRELPQLLITTFESEHKLASLTLGVLGRFGKLSAPLFDVARAVLQDVSAEVAEGNLKVFKELAPIFARFIDLSALTQTEAELIDGLNLAQGPVEQDGQELLRQAFSCYARARAHTDRRQQAQLVLRANCLIGLHEQTRLQVHIKRALDAPVDQLLLNRLAPAAEVPLVGRRIAQSLNIFGANVKRQWDSVLTRYAMNLSLPDGQEISLYDDLPARVGTFPEDLRELDDGDLLRLLARFDHHLDSLQKSGANDWADLHDRMGFIVDLFRSRQQDLRLFIEPFTLAQKSELEQGRIPKDLDPPPHATTR